MRQHIIERQQYWDCHGMKCLYNVLFNQIAHKYNCSDTTLQLTWSKHSIHNYYNMFLSCRFLGNNIAIIMTFKIHRRCCLTEIYLKIDRENNLLWNILMCVWGQWWYTSMWYWLTLARMEMFSRTYLKRTWWSYWHCTCENELGIVPVGIPWSLNTFNRLCLFVPAMRYLVFAVFQWGK